MGQKPEVDGRVETSRFSDISYEDFGARALDSTLTDHEKIGFPDAFREGHTEAIWADLLAKMPNLAMPGARILDIGCGCGPLPRRLIGHAEANGQSVALNDHPNMLSQLPESHAAARAPGRFPDIQSSLRAVAPEGFDAIVCYSVLQVAAAERNPFQFVDAALELLAPGGQLLFGDVPNFSKLRRFLASDAGARYHMAYMKTAEAPLVPAFALGKDRLDDGFVLGLLGHIRLSGFDAYVLPQLSSLPMSTRREDILVCRP